MKKNERTNQLIRENAQLQEKLTPENEKFYSDILIYCRLKGFFLDDERLEAQLLEVLQDILEAQENGETATDYFGESSVETAQGLLTNLPKTSWLESLKLVGMIFGISSLITLGTQLGGGTRLINVSEYLMGLIAGIFFVGTILVVLKDSIYSKLLQKKWILYIVLSVISGLSFILWWSGKYITLPALQWQLSRPQMACLILVVSVVLVYLALRFYKGNEEFIFGMVPFVVVQVSFGLVAQFVASFSQQMKFIQIACLIASCVWFYFILFKQGKPAKTKERSN